MLSKLKFNRHNIAVKKKQQKRTKTNCIYIVACQAHPALIKIGLVLAVIGIGGCHGDYVPFRFQMSHWKRFSGDYVPFFSYDMNTGNK